MLRLSDEQLEGVYADSKTTYTVQVSPPAPTRFNVKLEISVKGVRTWELTVLNANSVIEATKLAAALDEEMVKVYGIPKEPERLVK